jgi:phage gpG-like protein
VASPSIARVTIEVAGQRQLDIGVNRFITRLGDMRPFGPAFREAFVSIEQQQFASKGGAGASGGWQPLSTKYAEWKAARRPGAPLLVFDGALKASLTGGSGFVYVADKMFVTMGSSVPYAIFHQTGTSRMPARQPISLSDNANRMMGRALGKVARELGLLWGGPGLASPGR